MSPAGAGDRARAMAAFAAAKAPRWTPKLVPHRRKVLAGFFVAWIEKSRNYTDLVKETASIETVLGKRIAQPLREWYEARRTLAATHPAAAREIAVVKSWANPLRDQQGEIAMTKVNAIMNAIVPGARLGFVPPTRPVIANTITNTNTIATTKPTAIAKTKRSDTSPGR